jgi:hypothetical protein
MAVNSHGEHGDECELGAQPISPIIEARSRVRLENARQMNHKSKSVPRQFGARQPATYAIEVSL